MKEYFVVNNQEDEDGCVLYSANAIIDKGQENDPQGNFRNNTNKKAASTKTHYDGKTPFRPKQKEVMKDER